MPLIHVNNLRKEYKRTVMEKGLKGAIKNLFQSKYEIKVAVNDISFEVEEQEAVGYIGANGSGKSTTIKMLSGILTPTSGELLIDNIVPHNNRIKNNQKIGVVFGQRSQLWWDVPIIESYKLLQKIYEVEDTQFKKNLQTCVEALEIGELLKFSPRQLSLGQKMRCEIGSIMLYNPKIIFLDEPTIGLDVHAKESIRLFINRLNREKKTTVFLTSHDFQDIEDICSRIIILDKGNIVWDGSKNDIKDRFTQTKTIKLYVHHVPEPLIESLNCNQALVLKEFTDNYLIMEFNVKLTSPVAIISLVHTFTEIKDIEIKEISIESIVKQHFYVGS